MAFEPHVLSAIAHSKKSWHFRCGITLSGRLCCCSIERRNEGGEKEEREVSYHITDLSFGTTESASCSEAGSQVVQHGNDS